MVPCMPSTMAMGEPKIQPHNHEGPKCVRAACPTGVSNLARAVQRSHTQSKTHGPSCLVRWTGCRQSYAHCRGAPRRIHIVEALRGPSKHAALLYQGFPDTNVPVPDASTCSVIASMAQVTLIVLKAFRVLVCVLIFTAAVPRLGEK